MVDQTQQAFNFEDTLPPAEDNQSLFGYTAEGVQQEAEKYAEDFTEDDASSLETAASYLVPYYDSGVNIANVVEEYLKPEEERDYDYIKSQFKEAGQSAALETGLLLMGGVATKYGAKGIKALANKARQYEVDPNSMSAFGVGAIKKKASKPLEIGFNEELQDGQFLKGYNASTAADMAEKAKNATAGNTRANALMNAAVPEGTRVGVRLNLNSTIPDMPRGLDKLQTLHKGSFSGKAMSYLPFATVRNVTFNVSQKGRTAIASRINKIDTPEAKSKFPAMSVDGDYVPNKNLLDEGGDLVEVGLNPKDHHLFIDLKTGQAVKGAEEATIIGDRVYARGVEYWKKAEAPAPTPTQTGVDIPSDVRFKFKKGGMAMDDQMKLTFRSRRTGYALGGEVEAIDPVSGNEVPPGSTPKEVRDDIPAMLSEGEYVVPADVTRYYGVKFFEDLREKAKLDLEDMAGNGRIGGEPVPEDEDDLTEDEMALLQEVLASEETVGMAVGGMVNPQIPSVMPQQSTTTPQLGVDQPQPTAYNKPIGMAAGGSVNLDPFGNPVTSQLAANPIPSVSPTNQQTGGIYGVSTGADAPPTTAVPRVSSPAPITGTPGEGSTLKTVFFIHKDGRRISVLMLKGRPISSVPADFSEFVEDTPENRQRLNFGVTEGATTEGATVGVTGTSTGESGSDEYGTDDFETETNYKEDIKTKVDPSTPEGVKVMYEDSGVDINDTVGAAKKALDDAFKISKGAGTFLGALVPGVGVLAGIGSNISQLSALSKANANKNMAEFLGKEDEAKAIQKEIDSFLKDAPGMVSALDGVFSKGTQRFNNALEAATNISASKDVPDIFRDDLNEVGKKNIDEYLLANSAGYRGATIDDSGAIVRETAAPTSVLRPRLRPDLKAEETTQPKTTTGAVKGTTKPREASLAYNPEGTNTSYMEIANSLTPNDGRSYVGGQLVDDKTKKPYVAPKKDKVTTVTGRTVVVNTESTKEGTIGAVTSGGQYAGDGFEWKKSDNGNYLTRTYTGNNEGATGSNDTTAASGDSSCFLTTAIVERRGERDDGPTLTKLRKFRDTYLVTMPHEVEEYYNVAPKIVAAIPDTHSDWSWIGSQIDKSIGFIDKDLPNEAYKTYKAMVVKLKKDWI